MFVGNPIMHHCFGIDPTELGQAPFALALSGAVQFWAHEIGIEVSQGARLYMLSCIAGAMSGRTPGRRDAVRRSVPAGQDDAAGRCRHQREIVLGNRDRVVAASSPTGPAFEGAEILRPTRRHLRRDERVRIDPVTLAALPRVDGTDKWSDAVASTNNPGRRASPAYAAGHHRGWQMYLCGIISKTALSMARWPPAHPHHP